MCSNRAIYPTLLFMVLLQPCSGLAQQKKGKPLYRITILMADSSKAKGFLDGVDSTTISIRDGHQQIRTIPATGILTIRVKDKRLVRKGMNKGALWGGLLTGVIFAINHEPLKTDGFKTTGTASPLVDFTVGAILGSLVGIPIGAAVNTKSTTFTINQDVKNFLACRKAIIVELGFTEETFKD